MAKGISRADNMVHLVNVSSPADLSLGASNYHTTDWLSPVAFQGIYTNSKICLGNMGLTRLTLFYYANIIVTKMGRAYCNFSFTILSHPLIFICY